MMTSAAGGGPIRVMLVDDSAVVRGVLEQTLTTDANIHIAGKANNGQEAIEVLKTRSIDVVVLDIEMPVMDGLTALPRILESAPNTQVLIASTLSQHNAEPTVRALEAGAADYVPKPSGGVSGQANTALNFREDLLWKVRALGKRRSRTRSPTHAPRPTTPPRPSSSLRPTASSNPSTVPSAIGIASSTGGPKALMTVLQTLTSQRQPILITQHMPATFTSVMADNLSKQCGVAAAEARDGQEIVGGQIYIAPGGYHMIVDGNARKAVIRLRDTPPVNFCKPSADPMFKSMVALWGRRVMAVILTGMGHDGLDGARSVHRAGGPVIAQDEATSTVWGMPQAVVNDGIAHNVCPLNEIGPTIRQHAGPGGR